MSGIGVIIILQQIYPIVGLKAPVKVLDMLINYPSALAGGISFTALLLGIGTILIIWLLPKLTKTVPATLVALIAMTVLSLFLNLDDSLIIGTIPSGLPMPFFAKSNIDLAGIDWASALKAAIAPGLTLACLGSIDTLLTSVVADNITKTKHNSNKELIGQGIGNAVAGLFCGLGSLVKFVPLSVLAGILITVGAGIIDMRGFKDLHEKNKELYFSMVMGQPMKSFMSINLVAGIVPENHVFETFKDCANFLSPKI